MRRVSLVLMGLVLLGTGILLGAYGLFAILYRGDSGSNGYTYVTLGGHELNAHIVGAVALAIAVLLVFAALAVLKRNPRRARPS